MTPHATSDYLSTSRRRELSLCCIKIRVSASIGNHFSHHVRCACRMRVSLVTSRVVKVVCEASNRASNRRRGEAEGSSLKQSPVDHVIARPSYMSRAKPSVFSSSSNNKRFSSVHGCSSSAGVSTCGVISDDDRKEFSRMTVTTPTKKPSKNVDDSSTGRSRIHDAAKSATSFPVGVSLFLFNYRG